ncbi:MAG TPA: hypothetical protein IGR64_14550 [Leptolyngbyaceae cyanobacterium M65_K2018_010]|nr:hypothetical protein [Leptolyngbyaceae cyanobacterium M65_K2018_010]
MEGLRRKRVWVWSLALGILSGVVGCSNPRGTLPPRNVNLYQEWSLQPGDKLAGYLVQSGLGDVAIDLKGNRVFMPFDGQVQSSAGQADWCVIVSSPDVPAYLFRLCGLKQPKLGDLNQGDSIGRGDVIAFATMRRQADGTWAMVEPAKELIAQFLGGS